MKAFIQRLFISVISNVATNLFMQYNIGNEFKEGQR